MSMKILAEKLGKKLLEKKLILTTAESCTGGGVAKAITDIPGSSRWFECGYVTYSNHAKTDMLGVELETLETFGAVSEQTAREMAEGALKNSRAQIAISTTGIAGPDGGSNEKPVGMVCFAWAFFDQKTIVSTEYFFGDRIQVREQAIEHVLQTLLETLQ